jgi:hypothetical protein
VSGSCPIRRQLPSQALAEVEWNLARSRAFFDVKNPMKVGDATVTPRPGQTGWMVVEPPAHFGSGQTPGASGRRASGGQVNPRRDSVPGPARAGLRGARLARVVSGRGPGLPVSSTPQARRLGALVTACTARVDRATHRSSVPLPLRRWRCRFRPQGRGRRTSKGNEAQEEPCWRRSGIHSGACLARTRRWSKALKRPLPWWSRVPVPLPARVGETERGSRPGARSVTWGSSRRFRLSRGNPGEMCGGRPSNRSARAHRDRRGSGIAVRLRKRSGEASDAVEPQEAQRPR